MVGQPRRHRAEAPQRRRRQHEGPLDGEARPKIMLLSRPVCRQHPPAEHAPGLEGHRHLPSRVLGRVVHGKPGPGERRQQQHRHQGTRAAPVSEAQPHTAQDHPKRTHPKVNPISLAPAPSSQLAVTCATVTGEASTVPLTVIETIPARARVRPA